jgi:ribA/ribD-fused uncharacterized protein
MIVSTAHVYDEYHKMELRKAADLHEKVAGRPGSHDHMRNAIGKFADFGLHWYFDNPKIYYAELPPSPEDLNRPPHSSYEEMECRSVYLFKGDDAIEINASGFIEGDGQFQEMEVWGNEVDLESLKKGKLVYVGRGSFRVFADQHSEVFNFKKDGWVEIKSPPRKFMKLKDCALKLTDKMVLFWGSPFSQWYSRPFVVNGVTYNCAEQFMMAMKAKKFGDEESLFKIMASRSPSEQKKIGRMVKNFDSKEWDAISRDVVTLGNRAKFTQHEDLKALLLETGNLEIVEASPYDTLWGIGLGEQDPRCLDKATWQGKNWLGECLMRVRQELFEKSEEIE